MNCTFKMLPIFCLVSLVCSCSLDIEIEDRAADPNAITDVVSARRALATTYANYTDWQVMMELSAMSDDVMPSPVLEKNVDLSSYYYWREEQLIILSQNIWESGYKTILFANAVLERLPSIVPATENVKQQLHLIANEAKVLKALSMFNLMRLFSPRYPAVGAENLQGIVAKSSVKKEVPHCMSLKTTADSIRSLVTPYLNEKQNAGQNNYLLTPDAARCLAADLELWTGNYRQVIALCEPMVNAMDETVFGEKAYSAFWKQDGSKNEIELFNINYLAFAKLNFFNTWGEDKGDYLLVRSGIDYLDADSRKPSSVISDGKGSFLLGKYNAIRRNRQNIRYVNIYRTADFVFPCAEAYARTQQAGKAIALMNRYLATLKIPLIDNTISENELIERILNEKQKEFIGEGRRYFDLKRTRSTDFPRSILFNDQKANSIKADDFRWTLPIPASEYRYNNRIIQNKGWEKFMPKVQL